ncbi:MAG: hypothetical protein Kow0092_08480 [Deferrisomatales bacterium]
MKHLLAVPHLRNLFLLCAALVGVLLAYNIAYVCPSFDHLLTANTEEEALRVASFLTHHVLHEGRDISEEAIEAAELRHAREQFKLWKIKVFAPDGTTVFSTDPDEIGQVNTKDYFHERVARGEVLSRAATKHGRSSEGEPLPISLVETYVPVMDGGRFRGAFEIYYDITARDRRQDAQLLRFSAASLGLATVFLGVVGLVLERTGRSLAERRKAEEKVRLYRERLVESEKMAALGGLVAGVAHEINTPVGAAVTAASTLEARTRRCAELFETNRMKRSDLAKYLDVAGSTAEILLASLRQAADLIRSFKQVAVDQSSEERRSFSVKQCLDDVLLSLRPAYKRTGHTIQVTCPGDLEMDSLPGALSRVFSNLLVNSLTHAFDEGERGTIACQVARDGADVVLRYRDDGKGMDEKVRRRIFEPFFTTRREVIEVLGGVVESRSHETADHVRRGRRVPTGWP